MEKQSEIQFDAVYQLQCGYNVDMITTWLYDTQTKQIKKLKVKLLTTGQWLVEKFYSGCQLALGVT